MSSANTRKAANILPRIIPPVRVGRGILLCTFICLNLLSACTANSLRLHHGLIERLKNRGPVALSSENPYLAGNLLVAREMDQSPELKGFIDHRGAPAAIEVEKDLFSPLSMYFYYPENREQFNLDDLDGSWVIKGPLTIARDKMKEVAALTRNIVGEPKLITQTSAKNPSATSGLASNEHGTAEEDPLIARLNQSTTFQSPRETAASVEKSEQDASLHDKKMILDLTQATKQAQAEVSPKGDVVHYVTYPGETLFMIARWYTFDRNNAERIARINKLSNPNLLSIGDSVVIPAYMVKNKVRLSEEAVKELNKSVP